VSLGRRFRVIWALLILFSLFGCFFGYLFKACILFIYFYLVYLSVFRSYHVLLIVSITIVFCCIGCAISVVLLFTSVVMCSLLCYLLFSYFNVFVLFIDDYSSVLLIL
jgi:hypothetical protein